MHSSISQTYEFVKMTHMLRDMLLGVLTDADLAYTPGGNAPTLGALCREMGDVERMYADSFKTFRMDYDYLRPDAAREGSVAALVAWYADLDNDLHAALDALSDEDVTTRTIDRGGFRPTIEQQTQVYTDALMLLYGKADITMKAGSKILPEQWSQWLG